MYSTATFRKRERIQVPRSPLCFFAPDSHLKMKIVLIGRGLVGSELAKQIKESKSYNLIAIASSKLMQLGSDLAPDCELSAALDIAALQAHAAANKPCVIVDCTSNMEIARKYPVWLKAGMHVCTPNKKGFSSELDLYKQIRALSANGMALCRYEATVGFAFA